MRWFRMIFAAALCLSLPAMAQAEGADADCAAVLAAPPFVDMLTRNEGRDFQEISSLNSGRALVGRECSVDNLNWFFENAGWELMDYVKETYGWVDGEYVRLPESERESDAYFCLKRPTLFGRFGFRCRSVVSVVLKDGQVNRINAGINK